MFTIFSKKWQLEIQTMSASTRLSFSTELCEEVLKDNQDTLDTLASPGSVKRVYLVYWRNLYIFYWFVVLLKGFFYLSHLIFHLSWTSLPCNSIILCEKPKCDIVLFNTLLKCCSDASLDTLNRFKSNVRVYKKRSDLWF